MDALVAVNALAVSELLNYFGIQQAVLAADGTTLCITLHGFVSVLYLTAHSAPIVAPLDTDTLRALLLQVCTLTGPAMRLAFYGALTQANVNGLTVAPQDNIAVLADMLNLMPIATAEYTQRAGTLVLRLTNFVPGMLFYSLTQALFNLLTPDNRQTLTFVLPLNIYFGIGVGLQGLTFACEDPAFGVFDVNAPRVSTMSLQPLNTSFLPAAAARLLRLLNQRVFVMPRPVRLSIQAMLEAQLA